MKKIIFLLIVILVIGLVVFRIFIKKEKSQKISGSEAFPVEVVNAFKGDIMETVSTSGTIKSEQEIKVFPKAMGRIEKIYVKEGEPVKKGQVIAQIEKDVLQKQVEALRTALNAAKTGYKTTQSPLRKQELENLDSGIKTAKTGLELAENNYNRTKKLYESGSISKVMFEQAEFQYIQVKTEYENLVRQRQMLVEEGAREVDKESAKAQVSGLEAQLRQAEDALKDTTVYSPLNGWVSMKFFNEGELFSAAGGMPLFIIVDNKDIYLEIQVSEKEIGKIKSGQDVDITIDAIPDKKFYGKVKEINPAVVSYSRAAQVKISISNNNGEIKSGMFARCEIVTSKHTNSVLIPKDCIKKKGNTSTVFVVENDVANEKEIKIGLMNTENVEVLEGLKEGEKVVIAGQSILKNGDKVKIVK